MDKRDLILKEAKKLISNFGFKKTTMDDIANACRMSKASLYYYFNSKEDIFREIIEEEGNILRSQLQEVLTSDLTPKEKLRRYAMTRFKFLRSLGLYYRTLREEYYNYFPFVERERKKFDEFELDALNSILLEGVKRGDFDIENPRLYAFMLLQAIKGLEYPIATGIALKLNGKEIRLEDALNLLLRILQRGIERK